MSDYGVLLVLVGAVCAVFAWSTGWWPGVVIGLGAIAMPIWCER